MQRNVNRILTLALVAMFGLTLPGCVAQREKDDIEKLYRQAREQIIELQAQLEEAELRIDALQQQQTGADAAMQAQLDAAVAERDRLREALAEAEDRLRNAGTTAIMLPQPLNDALVDLAEQYPDLMTFDEARGMVKFRSDLTFNSGSAEVKAGAAESLARLARILSTPLAAEYEVRIVGHTDNVRISRPSTRAKHPTNWHLSVHRAISVKDALEKAGQSPARMSVAGYGQYRPVVPNGRNGAEANRRVEIFLTPMVAPGEVEPAARTGAARTPVTEDVTEQTGTEATADEPPAMFK